MRSTLNTRIIFRGVIGLVVPVLLSCSDGSSDDEEEAISGGGSSASDGVRVVSLRFLPDHVEEADVRARVRPGVDRAVIERHFGVPTETKEIEPGVTEVSYKKKIRFENVDTGIHGFFIRYGDGKVESWVLSWL